MLDFPTPLMSDPKDCTHIDVAPYRNETAVSQGGRSIGRARDETRVGTRQNYRQVLTRELSAIG